MPARAKRSQKRRLALPATLIKNLEDARKNLKTVQHRGAKEVGKLYNKVIEIDFVKQVRKTDLVKRATRASNDFSREFETRARKAIKEIEAQLKHLRDLLPVPTRTEVEKLSRKVNDLAKKLDEIVADEKQSAAN